MDHFEAVPAGTCEANLGRLAPNVHAATAVSHWQGEDCDYGMAIDTLLLRDGGNGDLLSLHHGRHE